MADENIVQGNAVPVNPAEDEERREQERESYTEALRRAMQDNPSLATARLDTQDPEAEIPQSGGFWRGLGRNVKSLFTTDGLRALGRGATRAIDETFEFATEDIGGAVVNYTPGLKELVFTDDEQEWFEEWYANRGEYETTVFSEEFRNEHLGYKNETLALNLVEGITQFGVGFAALGGTGGASTILGRLGVAAGKGALVDMAVFDPMEGRLADIANQVPILRAIVPDMMTTQEDDSVWEGRLKNALEGIVIGSTIDIFAESLKALRAARRAKAGEIEVEDAIAAVTASQRRAREIAEQAIENGGDDAVVSARMVDGEPQIVSIDDLPYIDDGLGPRPKEPFEGEVFHGGGKEAEAGTVLFESGKREVAAEAGEVTSRKVRLEDPLYFDDSRTMFKDLGIKPAADAEEKALRAALRRGHDGIVLRDPQGGIDTVMSPGKALRQEMRVADTFEPFPPKGFDPTFKSARDIPDASYDGLVSLNVLNVLPRGMRDEAVYHIGRVLQKGGTAVVGVRKWVGDVSSASRMAVHLDEAGRQLVTSKGTYQKGFDRDELVSYLSERLGASYKVEAVPGKGPGAVSARITRVGDKPTAMLPEGAADDFIDGLDFSIGDIAQNTKLTQVGNTGGSYAKAGDILDEAGAKKVLDYGAGKGHGASLLGGQRSPTAGKPKGGVPTKQLGDAQVQAEAINSVEALKSQPTGGALIERRRAEFLRMASDVNAAANLDEAIDAMDRHIIPLGYVAEPSEILQTVRGLAGMFSRKSVSVDQMKAAASDLFAGIEPDQALAWARRTFGDTENLYAHLLGLRAYLIQHVKATRHLAKTLDNAPNSPVLASRLGESLDTMFNLYQNVAGVSSNVGRALRSNQIEVGARAVPKEVRAHREVLDDYRVARELYEDLSRKGADPEALNAALDQLDEIGGKMGDLVGGRPKNKSGLSKISTSDANRRAKADQQALPGMEPAKAPSDNLPRALKWYDDAADKLGGSIREAQEAAETVKELPLVNPTRAHKAFSEMSRADIRRAARMIFLADDIEVHAVMGHMMNNLRKKSRPRDKSFVDKAVGWRVNFLLSGPRTHLTNFLNNIAFAQLNIGEYFWAGAAPWRMFDPEAAAMRQAGGDMLIGYWGSLRDSWRLARKSFMVGDNMLAPGTARGHAYQVGNIAEMGKASAFIQTLNPSRWLMAADELAQQMAYRGNLYSQLAREARASGVPKAEIGEFIAKHFDVAFDESGHGIIPSALRFSEEMTFKTPLAHGTVAKSIQDFAGQHAIGRLLFPFIRTPANLMYQAYRRTPFAAKYSRYMQEELAAGGARAMKAKSQIEIGSAFLATAGLLAANGMVTGRGPTDPALRQQWLRHKKPYTIYLPGNVQIQYRKGDPIMMGFAVMADLTSALGEIGDEDYTELAGSLLTSVVSSLSSKSYLQGVSMVSDVLMSGDPRKATRVIEDLAKSFVVPAVVRQLDFDPAWRDTNNLLDRMMDMLPGFSQQLPPRRNVFGEPVMKAPGWAVQQINPFTVFAQSEAESELTRRLFNLGRAFSMPSKKQRVGQAEIDLTRRGTWAGPKTPNPDQAPYDRWLEISGQLRFNGKTLREAITEYVMSDEFMRASHDGEVHEGGQAYMEVSRILSVYQSVAWGQVLQEYPKLIEEQARLRRLGGAEIAGDTSAQGVLKKLAP